jgi:hypothetical protein
MTDNFERVNGTDELTWDFLMQNLEKPDLLYSTYNPSTVEVDGKLEPDSGPRSDWGVSTNRNIHEFPIFSVRGGKHIPGPNRLNYGNIVEQHNVYRFAGSESYAIQNSTISRPFIGPPRVPENIHSIKSYSDSPSEFNPVSFERLVDVNGYRLPAVDTHFPNSRFGTNLRITLDVTPGNRALREPMKIRSVIESGNDKTTITTSDVTWSGVIAISGNYVQDDLSRMKILTVYEEKLLPRLPVAQYEKPTLPGTVRYGKGKSWSVPGGKTEGGDPIIQALVEFIEEATTWRTTHDYMSSPKVFQQEIVPDDGTVWVEKTLMTMEEHRNNSKFSLSKVNTDPGIDYTSVPYEIEDEFVNVIKAMLQCVVSVCTVSGSGLMYLLLDLDKLFRLKLDYDDQSTTGHHFLSGFFDTIDFPYASDTAKYYACEGISQRAVMLEAIPTLFAPLLEPPRDPESTWWYNDGGGYSLRDNMFNVAAVLQRTFHDIEVPVIAEETFSFITQEDEDREQREDNFVNKLALALEKILRTQDAELAQVQNGSKPKVSKKYYPRYNNGVKIKRFNGRSIKKGARDRDYRPKGDK